MAPGAYGGMEWDGSVTGPRNRYTVGPRTDGWTHLLFLEVGAKITGMIESNSVFSLAVPSHS